MSDSIRKLIFVSVAVALPLGLTGCVLAPRSYEDEKAALARAKAPYAAPFERRVLPELPAEPTWHDVLHRAMLASGDVEAAYFEWAAAVWRVPQAGAYPNSPLSVGFEYMFSGENLKGWDRTTLSAGPDPMENLAFPTKPYQAAKVALHDARAAAQRFRAAKFDLQQRVLSTWADYALLAEQIRIQTEHVALVQLMNESAAARVRAGATQQDVLRAEVERQLAEDQLQSLESRLSQVRAQLNALLSRAADVPLPPPSRMPPARPVPADDAALLAIAVDQNPELAALAQQVAGRHDALELARMRYIPDFNPFGGFTGSVSQFIGVGVSLPTVIPRIQGMVNEARADLARMQAMRRQATFDRASAFVATLYAMRNAQRQAELFERQILPASRRLLDNARQGYAAGQIAFIDLLESQRTLLDVRRMLAEAQAEHERRLAELEALAGVDIETIAAPTTQSEEQNP